jgi:hypothetical protein
MSCLEGDEKTLADQVGYVVGACAPADGIAGYRVDMSLEEGGVSLR